jgi:hypothetical protein
VLPGRRKTAFCWRTEYCGARRRVAQAALFQYCAYLSAARRRPRIWLADEILPRPQRRPDQAAHFQRCTYCISALAARSTGIWLADGILPRPRRRAARAAVYQYCAYLQAGLAKYWDLVGGRNVLARQHSVCAFLLVFCRLFVLWPRIGGRNVEKSVGNPRFSAGIGVANGILPSITRACRVVLLIQSLLSARRPLRTQQVG